MKKIIYLLNLIVLCSCSNGLPKFAHKHISEIHGTTDYTIVRDDTVTIPVKRLLAIQAAINLASLDLYEEYAAATNKAERSQAIEKAEKAAEEYRAALLECGRLIDFPHYNEEYSYDQYRVITTSSVNYKKIKTHIKVGTEEISTIAADALNLFKKAYNSYDDLRSSVWDLKSDLRRH